MSRSKHSRWQISEQKQRFAIRKFSQGVFSVLVGTMFVFGTPVIAQGDEVSNLDVGVKKSDYYQIHYQNVTEDSLTPEQKSKIVHDSLPKDLVDSDQVYYLVYRTAKGTALPQTGEFAWELDKLLVGSGLLIAALGMLPKRARKYRFLTAIIVASSTASLGTSISISVSANVSELSKNDRTYLVAKGETLPEISTQIPGHEYIGYILISDIKHPIPSISSNDLFTTEMEPKRTSDAKKTSTNLENTKETIAYETMYVDDPDLELGKTKVKVAGQPGERTIVYEVKRDATGKELSRVEKSNTVTKDPVSEVIARGTKAPDLAPEETVSEESKVETIAYETMYVDDPDLELGKTKVKVAGQPGERTIVYEVKRDATGKELSRVEKSNTVTKDPVSEVIARGTKALDPTPEETVSEESKVETIAYETMYVDDPDLELGKTKVKVAGQPGERTIVYEVKRDATGKELSRVEKSNTVTKDPVSEVIARGTKALDPTPEETVSGESKVETIAYETMYVDDPDLELGKTKVKVAGQPGERTIVYEVKRDATGKELSRVEKSNTVTKAPVSEVIARGTKALDLAPEETISEESKVETIAYETMYVDDPDLELGKTKVKVAGQPGERTIVYEVKRDATGKELSRVEKSNTVTKDPVSEVIVRGTKPLDPTPEETVSEESKVETIAYETMYVDDPDLELGKTKVKVAGQPGERTIVYEVKRDAAGKELSRVEKSNTVTKDPVSEVIARGTKPLETISEESKVETIAYETMYVDDPDLELGKTKVKVAGQLGERTIVYEVKRDATGKELSRVEKSNTVTKAPVSEVIARGTKLYPKPVVDVVDTLENEDGKAITVNYGVNDPAKRALTLKATLYRDDQKISEQLVDLTQLTTTFTGLAYHTPYRIETEYSYNIGVGDQIEKLKPITFELTPKKVELKNFNNISLYQIDPKGKLNEVTSLSSLPTDPKNYVARVVSKQNKDWYLPISGFKEISVSDKPKYQAMISYPELVSYQVLDGDLIAGHSFLIDKTPTQTTNEYTNFKDLITAMNADPSGEFVIASDMDAFGSEALGNSFVTVPFSGSLRSKQGNIYTIYNLDRPLFNVIQGGHVNGLKLVDVNITGAVADAASLARVANNATIAQVHVKGNLNVNASAGGVIAKLQNSTLADSSFTGTLKASGTNYDNVGGLVGFADGNSLIQKSFADVMLTADVLNTSDNIGGLVGRMNNGQIQNVYAKGTLVNKGQVKRAGGLIGSSYINGRVRNALSFVDVKQGYIFHGDVDYDRNVPHNNTYFVEGIAAGMNNLKTKAITLQKAEELITSWQIPQPIFEEKAAESVDYSKLRGYQENRAIAYRNVEKLLPFYDRYTILKYGNKVATDDKLATTLLLSVVALKDDKVTGDTVTKPGELTGVMLHFADGTIEKRALTALGNYKQTKINEYSFENDLLYTPYQLTGAWDEVLTQLATEYAKLDYYAPATSARLQMTLDAKSVADAKKSAVDKYKAAHPNEELSAQKQAELEATAVEKLRRDNLNSLYLQEAFAKVTSQSKQVLSDLTTSMPVMDLDSAVIKQGLIQRLDEQKLALTLGLAYLERLYHINYGTVDIHDLAAYYPDFYGKKVDLLKWLGSFADLGGNRLAVKNNYNTYSAQFSELTGSNDVISYLEKNRRLFMPNVDDNTWFKGATKAYIYEASSKQVPDATVQIYDRLKGKNRLEYRNYLLPLLNLSEKNMFMFTTMTTVSFGIYERYIDEALKSDPAVYAAKQANVDQAVAKYAQIMADYYDTWYRIVDDKVKDQLLTRDIPIWDGYWIIDNTKTGGWKNRWVDKFDKSVTGVYEFFAPVGKMYAPNGVGAYANGSLVHFVVDGQLSDYGVAVSSHEMTHNLDGAVYFNGYGRRQEMGAETFAMGLLEVPSTPDQSQYGLNLAFDWTNKKNLTQASSFSDFTSSADLQRYMKGVFDVTYLLDYAEAQAIVAMSNADRRQYLRQITYDTNTKQDKITNSGLTYAEGIKLTSWESLIDNNIVVARSLSGGSYGKNTYMTVPLYAPIYAGLQNDNGSVGGLLFRKTAFELLANRGWENGFIPYVSNQYKEQAKAEGEVFSDAYIFKQIWGDEYANYAEFKKAMFNERIAKKDDLRAITITYNKKQEKIDSFDKLQTLMDQASAADMLLMRAGKRAVNVDNLKKAIMVEYHALTDSFKTSIFN